VGEKTIVNRTLVREAEGKILLLRPMHNLEDEIQMDLK
jgi:hypothetical protein